MQSISLPESFELKLFSYKIWFRDLPVLAQSIWAHQLVESSLVSAPKLTDLYRTPRMST